MGNLGRQPHNHDCLPVWRDKLARPHRFLNLLFSWLSAQSKRGSGGGLGFAAAYRRLRLPGVRCPHKVKNADTGGRFERQVAAANACGHLPTHSLTDLELKARPLEQPQRLRCCWSGRPARGLRPRYGEVAGQAGRLSRGPVGAGGLAHCDLTAMPAGLAEKVRGPGALT